MRLSEVLADLTSIDFASTCLFYRDKQTVSGSCFIFYKVFAQRRNVFDYIIYQMKVCDYYSDLGRPFAVLRQLQSWTHFWERYMTILLLRWVSICCINVFSDNRSGSQLCYSVRHMATHISSVSVY